MKQLFTWLCKTCVVSGLCVLISADILEANVRRRWFLPWSKECAQYTYIICLLVESGIDSNATDFTGSTALDMLARFTFPELVQLILARRGVDVNGVDNHGRTPLAWASERESVAGMPGGECTYGGYFT